MPEERMNEYLDAIDAMPDDSAWPANPQDWQDAIDAGADWTPVPPGDVDRAWSMAAHLTKLHRYHLRAYLGWGRAYVNGLCTEDELNRYLACYERADALGISWRGWMTH